MIAMMQDTTTERRGGSRASVYAIRQVLALLVMLLAVLPHLTLAASPVAGTARTAMHHAPSKAETAVASVPCHEPRSDSEGPGTLPACCILGCGLLAGTLAPRLPSRAVAWSRLQRPETLMRTGISREPAKPPPRPEPVLL